MTEQTYPLEETADAKDDVQDVVGAATRDRNDETPVPGSAWPDEIPW